MPEAAGSNTRMWLLCQSAFTNLHLLALLAFGIHDPPNLIFWISVRGQLYVLKGLNPTIPQQIQTCPELHDSCHEFDCIKLYTIVFESQEKMFKTNVNVQPHCPLTSSREQEWISAKTLDCQKLESLPKICATDSMWLSLLAFTQLFFESRMHGQSQQNRHENRI